MDLWDALALVGAVAMVALVSARLWSLRRRPVRAWVLGRGKGGWLRWVELGLLPVTAVVLFEFTVHALGLEIHLAPAGAVKPWFAVPALRPLAVALQGGAALLLAGALRVLGASYRLGVDREHPGALVTRGVFAWSRHPLYLALMIWFAGVWMLYPNTFFFGSALGAALCLDLLAGQEEAVLLARHPDAYPDYRRRVPKYVPWPGRPRKR